MNILFLCTANSCRSILTEAVFNHMASPNLRAFSAGSYPRGLINPLTLLTLEKAGISATGLYSKSIEDLSMLTPYVVITVCDKAAAEACPLFLGQAIKAHWGLPDPSECTGTPAQIEQAFDHVLATIIARVKAFLDLPDSITQSDRLGVELTKIGLIVVTGDST
ncbi:arsenate reductase ArsC [uncultured Acinetobacter sp.]|jgi:arsenate reductase|uniref:arsenate reductase ArsC n=1 Tax=uncultured Acinetobacter sp. TaxID=165433 RepID=UPI00260C7BFA|nr:arsenate reductase ArsC [uncultured Acinetobacter sp.]